MTSVASSSTPAASSIPCGVPNSTRRAPASKSARAWRGDLRRAFPRTRTVEHVVRDEPRGAVLVTGSERSARAASSSGVNVRGRVEPGDDRQVHRDLLRAWSRARPPSVSTTVTAPTTIPTSSAEPKALARQPHERRVRAAAELELVGALRRRTPSGAATSFPIRSGTRSRSRRVREPCARLEAEDLAVRTRNGRRRAAATRSPRPRRSSPPGAAARGPARRATRPPRGRGTRGRPRRGRAPRSGRQLDRMHGERVQAGRPDPDALGRRGDLEQRGKRRLVPEVVEGRDDVEAAPLRDPGQRGVLARPLVRLQAEPELARPVVTSGRRWAAGCRPIRSMRMIRRSSGSGQQTRESCASQSPSARSRCFAGSSGMTACRA